jgi:hypothetical protein
LNLDLLFALAGQLALNTFEFRRQVEGHLHRKRIEASGQQPLKHHVNSAPTLFISSTQGPSVLTAPATLRDSTPSTRDSRSTGRLPIDRISIPTHNTSRKGAILHLPTGGVDSRTDESRPVAWMSKRAVLGIEWP